MISTKNMKDENTNPLYKNYIRIVRFLLCSVGSWPMEVIEKPSRFIYALRAFLLIQTTVVWIGQMNYISKHYKQLPFIMLGDLYVLMFLAIVTVHRCTMPYLKDYGKIIARFLSTFHLIHFKHMGKQYDKMYQILDKLSIVFTIMMSLAMFCIIFFFNGPPLYNNYKNGVFSKTHGPNVTLQFSIHYKMLGFTPFDYFTVTTIINIWICYGSCILVCANDVIMMLMVFQIIGHLLLLNYNLEHFPRAEEAVVKITSNLNVVCAQFTDDQNKMIKSKLVECVDYHRLIVTFASKVSSVFGATVGFNYMYHMGGLCLMLLMCSSGEPDAAVRYGTITVMAFGQLILMSIVFEVARAKSEATIESVYYVPWESMNLTNQRSYFILLNRIQTPINFTAMGLATVGVQTMLQILKASLSYFAFLRSIEE